MDNLNLVLQQTELEHDNLAHIRDVLRRTVLWEVSETKALPRKIGAVRFVAQSFQRYLERLLAMEEHDGYMHAVNEMQPHLVDKIDELRKQHDGFREQIRQVMPRLERVASSERDEFNEICNELVLLVDAVIKHNRKETKLLHEAFWQDEGGEG